MAPVRTRLSGPAIDCSDAVELANFYGRLLGWDVTDEYGEAGDSWAKIMRPDRGFKIEFQGLADYTPPVWPNDGDRQQMMMHLDVAVDDLEAGVAYATSLGAHVAEFQPQPHVRVMIDPAGHPFCLFAGPIELQPNA